jgi:hypothetical protein
LSRNSSKLTQTRRRVKASRQYRRSEGLRRCNIVVAAPARPERLLAGHDLHQGLGPSGRPGTAGKAHVAPAGGVVGQAAAAGSNSLQARPAPPLTSGRRALEQAHHLRVSTTFRCRRRADPAGSGPTGLRRSGGALADHKLTQHVCARSPPYAGSMLASRQRSPRTRGCTWRSGVAERGAGGGRRGKEHAWLSNHAAVQRVGHGLVPSAQALLFS